MQHLVLYINALIIPVIAAAFVTVIVLRKVKHLGRFFSDMEFFLLALLITSAAYLPMYYDYEFTFLDLGNITYSIGWNLVWMIYAFLWFRMIANKAEGKGGKVLSFLSLAFSFSYFTAWLICILVVSDQYELIMNSFGYIQLAVLVVFVLVSIDLLSKEASPENKYCLAGSVLLIVETSFIYIYSGENVLLKNMHVIIWFIMALISILTVHHAANNSVMETGTDMYSLKTEEDALTELKAEYQLTDRETDIFRMILQGKTNKDIGEELFIGEATVKTHIHNLLKKLSASNRVDAILLVKEKIQEK